MRYFDLTLTADPRYPRINTARFEDEEQLRGRLLGAPRLTESRRAAVVERARGWVRQLRGKPGSGSLLDSFMTEFSLTRREEVWH